MLTSLTKPLLLKKFKPRQQNPKPLMNAAFPVYRQQLTVDTIKMLPCRKWKYSHKRII